jgi:hypothetical protein
LLGKIKSGGKVTIAEKKLMDVLAVELAAEVSGKTKAEEISNTDAKVFLEGLLINPVVDQKTKIQIANILIPYQHARKGETIGKKDEKSEKAKTAGNGRFAAGKPPLALVK